MRKDVQGFLALPLLSLFTMPAILILLPREGGSVQREQKSALMSERESRACAEEKARQPLASWTLILLLFSTSKGIPGYLTCILLTTSVLPPSSWLPGLVSQPASSWQSHAS
ncbi:hypothetical protein GGR55DRAFT_665656 [Xylaria sp. FL0064]|nr:hypothetical protein GGR55DRAFT_665656 [Xylaria sp. FL0064]